MPYGFQAATGQGWNSPSLIGRTYGQFTAGVTASILLRVYVDATAGSSGGGLMQKLFSSVGDSTFYYTGSMHGKESDYAEGTIFRRMDPTMYAFVTAYTTEW